MKRYNIFLDAGGVILDETEHENRRAELTVKLISNINKSYNIEKYWSDVNLAVDTYITQIYNFIFWKNTQNIDLYNNIKKEYSIAWKEMNIPLTLMEGLKEVLNNLSEKYNIGILGQYNADIIKILNKSNLLKYFKYTETQEKYKITKPDPRYFELILKSANVKPEDSIMVGDRIDKDIIPAKQVGMKFCIRIKTGIHKNQIPRYPYEFPDLEINSIKDLINLDIASKSDRGNFL